MIAAEGEDGPQTLEAPLGAFDRVKQGIPVIDVAAMFQKDPQVLMAHPDAPYNTFADLAKAPTIFMGKDLYAVQFSWMKATCLQHSPTTAKCGSTSTFRKRNT